MQDQSLRVFFWFSELWSLCNVCSAYPVERDTGWVTNERFAGVKTDLKTFWQRREPRLVGIKIGSVRNDNWNRKGGEHHEYL